MLKIFYCQDWLANKIEAANNGIKSDGKKPPRLMPGVGRGGDDNNGQINDMQHWNPYG
jgi:hypothetical protein